MQKTFPKKLLNLVFPNPSEAGSILFAHGPTFMWGKYLGSVILAVSLGFILVNSFFKLKTPSEENNVQSSESSDSSEV
ncbi:MAG: hypothetical protein Ct9H90mP2_06600 [Dehalococcoidia bacterium]|nr:MAG: hypothetical protein Ct9H90mP2_06600 [Dehalococcoidia bacterium]